MAVTSVLYRADGWGVGELWLDGDRVVHHELPRARRGVPAVPASTHPWGDDEPPAISVSARFARDRDDFAPELIQRLQRFFAGEVVDFGDVRLDLTGFSAFQRALVHALRAVPPGEVVTYGELAALAGRPGAARAAGTFCARNRFAIFVPCHRVVAAAGIGGYGSSGVDFKRRLLALENVAL